MSESIKLTENDFGSIHFEEDSGGPERFVITIDGKSESHCIQLKEQILKNQKITDAISEYAKSDGLSICDLLARYEKYKRIAQRVELEHSKFAKLGFEGLQQNGKSQLHMLNFLLTGKLPHEMKYHFCKKKCGRRTDTGNGICRMCRGFVN